MMKLGKRFGVRIVSLALAVSMTLSVYASAYAAAPVSDVKDSWAAQTLDNWLEKGWLNGYPDGSVKPNNDVTRAEFAAMINKPFLLSDEAKINFRDLDSGDWAYSAIAKAVRAGYIHGYEDGTVGAGKKVSREEAAVMLAAVLNLDVANGDVSVFSDANAMAKWSKGAIGAVASLNVMSGYPDGTFRPRAAITRAEAVVSIDRALKAKETARNRTYEQAGTYGPVSGTETIAGNVTIAAPGVTLQNLIIEGDLVFGAGIGNGDATIRHVTVQGKTVVNGGGENSIHFVDSVLVTVEVDKKTGNVRIVAEGSSTVQTVVLKSSAKLEESGTTDDGFKAVELSGLLPANAKVTLIGNFSTVDVNAKSILISIPKGSVNHLNVGDEAENAKVDLGDEAKIVSLVLRAVTELLGKGIVITATMNEGSEGSSFENKPGSLEGPQKGSAVLPPPTFTPESSSPTVPEDEDNDGENPPATVAVSSVSVTPGTLALIAGGAAGTLTATVMPANAANAAVSWSSSDTSVATVDNQGVVTPVTAGTAVITVTTADGNYTATSTVTVTDAAGPVYAVTAAIQPDVAGTVSGTGYYEENTAVTLIAAANEGYEFASWQGDDVTVADAVYSFAMPAHDVALTANFTAKAVSVTGISLDQNAMHLIPGGAAGTLTATVTPANATNRAVTWSSSAPVIAEVSGEGVVTPKAIGTATITATTADGGLTASITIKVAPAVAQGTIVDNLDNWDLVFYQTEDWVFQSNYPDMYDGDKSRAARTGSVVADPGYIIYNFADIVNFDARVYFNVDVYTPKDVMSAEASVDGEHWSPLKLVFKDRKFVSGNRTKETVVPESIPAGSNFVKLVFQQTSNNNAISLSKVTIDTNVPVTGIALDHEALTLTAGKETGRIMATVWPDEASDPSVAWSSSDDAIATVDADGVVTPVAPGVATITATSIESGIFASAQVTVLAAVSNLVTAAVHPTDAGTVAGTGTYVWGDAVSLSAEANAGYYFTSWQIGDRTVVGAVYGFTMPANAVEVTANFASYAVPVAGIAIDQEPMELIVNGDTAALTASVTPLNASNPAVTWSTDAPLVAEVSSEGVVTPKAIGTATITATTVDGKKTASIVITVAPSDTPATIVDPLDNWDYAFAWSDEWLFKGDYPRYFEGDTSRAVRNTTDAQSGAIIYNYAGIAQFTAIVYFNKSFYEPKEVTEAYVSANGEDWEKLQLSFTNQTEIDRAQSRYRETVQSENIIPPGYSFLKFVFKNSESSPNNNAIQLSQMTLRMEVPVSSVALEQDTLEMTIGSTQQLHATVYPSYASNRQVRWTSSNEEVAVVTEDGIVVPKGLGTATITATTADGGKTAQTEVTVKAGTAVNVDSLVGLLSALDYPDIETITLAGDISNIPASIRVSRKVTINGGDHTLAFVSDLNNGANGERQGILVEAGDVTLEHLKVRLSTPYGWQGVYGIQVYGATGVVLDDVAVTGADAGILVNGAAVALSGNIHISGNEFGGIEVSRGAELPADPALSIAGATFRNDTEVTGKPTLWEDGVTGSVTGGTLHANSQIEAGQVQHYILADYAANPRVYESYRTNDIGDMIKKDSHYQIYVQPDPLDPGNKVAKMTYESTATSGNMRVYYPPAVTGKVVLKEKVLLEGSGSGIFHTLYMRTKTGSKQVQIWKLQGLGNSPGLYPGSSVKSATKPNDVRGGEWYSLTTIIDTRTATYDIYMENEFGYVLYEGLDLPLPAGLDYTAGLNQLYGRHNGSSATGAATYTDDFQLYMISDETYAALKVLQAEKSKSEEIWLSAAGDVAALPEGDAATQLQARLDLIAGELWQGPYIHAEQIVDRAARSKQMNDYDAAVAAVSELDAHAWKDELQARLDGFDFPAFIMDARAKVGAAETSKRADDYAKAAAAVDLLPEGAEKTSLLQRLSAIAATVETIYFSEDYEDKQDGSKIHVVSNYNVYAAVDPEDPDNIVAKNTFHSSNTSGFMEDSFTGGPISGHLIFTQKIRFEGQGAGVGYTTLLRSASTNGTITLWNMNKTVLSAGGRKLANNELVNDMWYKIIAVVDTNTQTYSVYLVGLKYNEVLGEATNISLPAADANNKPIDYGQGFSKLLRRIVGTVSGVQQGALYIDDWSVAGKPADIADAEVQAEIEYYRTHRIYYSPALRERVANATVLFEGGYYGYVNNQLLPIDSDHPMTTPILRNGVALAPLAFAARGLDAEAEWESSGTKVTLTTDDKTVVMEADQANMTVNGVSVPLDTPAIMVDGVLMGPVGNLVQAFGLNFDQDDERMLWIISGNPALFNPAADAGLLDELAEARYGVRKPDMDIKGQPVAAADAEARATAFENRNSPEALEALAKHLQVALEDDVPELAPFRALMASGQYEDALKAFQTYFYDKLSAMNDFDWENATVSRALSNGTSKAENLLFNVIGIAGEGAKQFGAPGTVDWNYANFNKPFDSETYSYNSFMWHPLQFNPLLNQYMASGNLSYLKKYAEYVDDWSLNSFKFKEILPQNLSDTDFNPAGIINMYAQQLRNLSKKETRDALPASTMARLLLRIVEEYPPLAIEYARSNPQNWSTQLATSLVLNGIIFDEFKDAKLYMRAGLRRTEDLATVQMLPDGADSEQSISYNREYLRFGAGNIYNFIKDRPDILTDIEKAEMEAHLLSRSKLMAHTLMPNGQYPGGFRIDTRDSWMADVRTLIRDALPSALEEPDIKAILALRSNLGLVPSYVAEKFPYGGYSFIRSGWTQQDQVGFMFSSTHPGNYDFHNKTGNNMFWLSAFGRDMIVPGEVGAYDDIPTPVLVDGKWQNGTFGHPTWGHRHVLDSAWDEPEDFRWGESEHFNLTEGLYDREYGTLKTGVISDVTHGRMLQFLRDAGLWIVTDRMTAEAGSRTYTVEWKLPAGDAGPHSSGDLRFKEGEIVTDNPGPNQASLRTQDSRSNVGNLSIYEFGSGNLATKQIVEFPETADPTYKVSQFYKWSTTFGGSGANVLVSLMVPRSPGGADLAEIASLGGAGTAGFNATMQGGRTIQYLVAANKNELLQIGNVAVQGESLLLQTETDGSVRGIALGVQSMTVNGVPQAPGTSDFEFTIDPEGSFEVAEPIYTPIANVEITPLANVFTDRVEVTMSNATADVDIRYTTDGSEPTLASALYTGPFTLTDTTLVKARAFRKGIASVPTTVSGTLASTTQWAVFTKQPMKSAIDVPDGEAGLHYRYYEGDWKDMIYRMDRLTPVQEGDAGGVFDFTAKQTDDPYGFAYSGYLNVPEDGIYTFYAPREWLRPDIMAGYDLEVFVDGEMWYPATRRQAFGTWSISLAEGAHTFEVRYVDYRGDSYSVYNTGAQPRIWNGTTPQLEMSGPGLTRQPIPAGMLIREP